MTRPTDLDKLKHRRERLRDDLAAVGDFRPGSLSAMIRPCGKPNCACARPGHPGRGLQYVLTRKLAGKTVTVHLRSGPELVEARVHVSNYKRSRHLVDELVQVNEAICAARPVSPLAEGASGEHADATAGSDGQKGGSSVRSPEAFAAELARLSGLAAQALGARPDVGPGTGRQRGLAAMENRDPCRETALGAALLRPNSPGCFTQAHTDEHDRPVRDADSTSYLTTLHPRLTPSPTCWRPRPAAAAPNTSANSSSSATAPAGSGTSPNNASRPRPRSWTCSTSANTYTPSPSSSRSSSPIPLAGATSGSPTWTTATSKPSRPRPVSTNSTDPRPPTWTKP
jgi:hypothetical protein